MKLRISLAIVTALILGSCATILNQKTVNVNVQSDSPPVKISVNNDTPVWLETPTVIKVERSRNDLLILAKRDSVHKLIQVNSRLSAAFWLGNMFSGAGIIGYGIDLSNPKRFTYPPLVNINFQEKTGYIKKSYKTWLPPQRHLVNLKISIPEANHLFLNKGHGYGNAFGFLGISGGAELYLTEKYFLGADIGTLTDFMIPFPAPLDYEGYYEKNYATFGDIMAGSDYKRWHYAIGLQYTETSHYQGETEVHSPIYSDTLKYEKHQNNFGLSFSTKYRISSIFNIGLNYYPSFLVFNNNNLSAHYTHLIFLDLIFRIEVYRPKKLTTKLTN